MRLLVADDNPDMRLLLRIHLVDAGWEVDEAASGAEALERIGDGRYDAVVLDHKMPGVTGLEVAEHLRARWPQLPLVLFSAYLEPHVEARARDIGVRTLSKTDLEELPRVVQELAAAYEPDV